VSADPTATGTRPLGALVERLAAEGRLRGTRAGGRPVPTGDVASIAVTGVTHDSRAVRPGMLFVAVPGLRVDGHDYVPAAIEAGAAGVIVERPIPGVAAPQVVVVAARPALGSAAAWWFGDPYFKATGFELINLPALRPTDKLTPPRPGTAEHKAWSRVHRMPPGAERARMRSETFPGIAGALAQQWGEAALARLRRAA